MTTIKLKNGSGAPTAGDLAQGEPALDLTNKRLYTEDSGGTVIEVGTNPTSVTTGDITATGTATFAGLTTTADVSFGDNDKAVFGAGSDLQIYHDGSNSYISEVGAGGLVVQARDAITFEDGTSGDNYIYMQRDNKVELYHAGSAKLATTSTGIDVTGTVVSDGLTVNTDTGITLKDGADTRTANLFLDGGAFQQYVTGSADIHFYSTDSKTLRMAITGNTGDISFYEDTGTTAKLFWDASAESLGVGTSSVAGALHVERENNYSGTDFEDNPHLLISNGTPTNHTAVLMFQSSGTDVADKRSGITGGNYFSNKHGLSFLGDLSGKDRSATPDMFIDSSGNVGIGTDSPSQTLQVESTNNNAILLNAPANRYNSIGFQSAGTNKWWLGRADSDQIAGDAFFIGTDAGNATDAGGLSAKVVIDSSGNVGIGTDSPAGLLHVSGITTQATIEGSSRADLFLVDSGASVDTKRKTLRSLDGSLIFGTENDARNNFAEAMRIDSSGNLLVSGTSSSIDAGSISLEAQGRIRAGRDGGAVMQLNRTTSDGDVAVFYKDSVSFGSIGVNGDRIYLSGASEGVYIDDSLNSLSPCTTTGGNFDNHIDLGGSASRFKDLYLSGDVNLANNSQITFASTSCNIEGNSSGPDFIKFTTANSEAARFDSSGNLLVGTTNTPTSSAGNIVLANGTAPTASATDGVILYAEDVSSSSELKVRDEAGNITTLSPHNFDLIPQGPSEDMAWSYYSERDGKQINVDMLKAIRVLEKLSGEQLVFEN